MKTYQLIAFDMDGTLLDGAMRIPDQTLGAIHEAASAGKIVTVATGRSMAEMQDYLGILSDVRYLISCSGAYVYDLSERTADGGARSVYRQLMDPDLVIRCLDIARKEDAYGGAPMANILTAAAYVQEDMQTHMCDYGMGDFQSLYDHVTTKVPDLYAFYTQDPFPIAKLNLYHVSPQSRMRTRERFAQAGIAGQIEMADAETTSLECTLKDLNKEVGLRALCAHLGLTTEEAIAVGDADNDLPMLGAAGLAIAMGNANDVVKKASDVIVADNDHNGCAEAIRRFLL